jgi:hypothetical protein
VSGALIRADYSSTTTDAEGAFSLDHVTPGPQLVFVQYEGEFYQIEANLPLDRVLNLPSVASSEAPAGTPVPRTNQ